jgi:LysM repeat protein
MVRRWNHLKGNSLRGRRVVYVHLPVTPNSQVRASASKSKSQSAKASSASQKSGVRHTVKPGETFYSIANSYNTSVDALKRDNGNPTTLRPGMILVVRAAR